MSKFKVGDRVNWVAGHGWKNVEVIDVGADFVRVIDGESRGLLYNKEIELAAPSPVRAVTRREIVPGDYSGVRIEPPLNRQAARISFCSHATATELRQAARIFNEIADVLEENAKVAA